MVEVPVTLMGMSCEESARGGLGFLKEIGRSFRSREDVLAQYVSAAVPKHAGLANAQVSAFELREMRFETFLIGH